jgi:class 3 adenylate cyclase
MFSVHHERYLRELRLFLEEICCDLVRFRHAAEDNVAPEEVKIIRESYLGSANGFADIRVQVKADDPYFIEIHYGCTPNHILASLTRKYCPGAHLGGRAMKVITVIDTVAHASWQELRPLIQSKLQDGLELEAWDEKTLLAMLRKYFGIEIDAISEHHVLKLREAVDAAKGRYAFDELWVGDEMQRALIWHFGFWRLKQLRGGGRLTPGAIIPPGLYKNVAVVMADICSFSSYMRDTRREDVIRDCLTTFYSKARYEILNTGGMMYQFAGDEAIGLYGIPDQSDSYLERTFDCAKALIDIGKSVSGIWQRQIDNVQSARGLHIGIAIGDMQIVSLRPFGRSHLGGLGEVINIAARLLSQAGPSEINVSNTFYEAINQNYQAGFRQCQPFEARHMGTLQTWKMSFPDP